MFQQATEIMVCETFPGSHCVYLYTGCCLAAGAPQVTTTSSGAFVASFMTDEDTPVSLHDW
jgi:hypothetical protein